MLKFLKSLFIDETVSSASDFEKPMPYPFYIDIFNFLKTCKPNDVSLIRDGLEVYNGELGFCIMEVKPHLIIKLIRSVDNSKRYIDGTHHILESMQIEYDNIEILNNIWELAASLYYDSDAYIEQAKRSKEEKDLAISTMELFKRDR